MSKIFRYAVQNYKTEIHVHNGYKPTSILDGLLDLQNSLDV